MIVVLEEMSGSLLHSKLIIDTRTYIWIIKHFLFKQLHVFIGSHFHAEKHTCRYQPVHHIHSHSSTFWEKVFLDLTCVLMLLLISVHLCIGQKASFWIMDKIRIAFPWTSLCLHYLFYLWKYTYWDHLTCYKIVIRVYFAMAIFCLSAQELY